MVGIKLVVLSLLILISLSACRKETLECPPLDESEFEFLLKENTTSNVSEEYNLAKNSPPEITLENKTIFIKENQTITLNPKITDPDNDKLVITYSGWMNDTTKQTTFYDAGIHKVTILATDGEYETQETITIIVEDVNQAPVFVSEQ